MGKTNPNMKTFLVKKVLEKYGILFYKYSIIYCDKIEYYYLVLLCKGMSHIRMWVYCVDSILYLDVHLNIQLVKLISFYYLHMYYIYFK